ncbi:Glutathione synthase/RimK-type ligase, ATP-grasp superfamily [Dyadobacter koreensis]|uniref:Glutathione synthase/RimK-type ligase, ATP-grasp superfamily n=1 Tax=Dyadobacter koreensis TaxID=408657 RepID=A0A1H6Y272_9BACT|nr:Glutathione synthase/RimK-type ligase, ATP-grasp superfamily [Dyadobacter koreensis]
MKKIGILYGMENTFPQAFIDRVNSKGEKGIVAEAVTIEKVVQADPTEYAVIIDRISQDVPFYRAYLKNAALSGTAVINNPFWWSADEKFFNNALAEKIGVPVPKTVLIPSKERPTDTSETSFRNLAFPLAWEEMFRYIGFPAYMKPHDGGGWKSVYQVNDPHDMWRKHEETGQLIMMLQEEIQFTDYFRCYCIGQKDVLIMPYEPRNPHHLRYASEIKAQGEEAEKLLATVKDYTLKLNIALGYDFNTVEFAVRDGIPIAIDFCNPAPDADVNSVGADNFEWVVEAAANMAIERAKQHKPGQTNLTWGTFVKDSVSVVASAPKPSAEIQVAEPVELKKAAPKKAAPAKAPATETKKPAATTKAGAPAPVPFEDIPKKPSAEKKEEPKPIAPAPVKAKEKAPAKKAAETKAIAPAPAKKAGTPKTPAPESAKKAGTKAPKKK